MSDEVKAEAKKKRGWLVIEAYRSLVEMIRLSIEIGPKVLRDLAEKLDERNKHRGESTEDWFIRTSGMRCVRNNNISQENK